MHLSFTHLSQDQLGAQLQQVILQIPPSSRLRSWQSKHSGCSYQYLSVGVRSSLVSCSRVQATLDNCISFTRWGWTPSRSCRRGVLLACKAYARFAICCSLLVVCVRTKGGVESALASFIRAPFSGTHAIAANSLRAVLAAVRMHNIITTLPSTIFRNIRHA